MTKIWIVNVMNRFENDKVTAHYFTTEAKAKTYADKINAKYEEARKAGNYGTMVYHVDKITAVDADED